MTASGDFIPGDAQEFESAPAYPTLFGLQLTPALSGILLALLGLAGAVWLYFNLLSPTLQTNRQLRSEIAEKEALLVDQAAIQQQIEEAEQELAEAERLQSDVLSLFATEDSVDTLLLDLNARIQAANAGIQDENRRAKLNQFELAAGESGIITDSSLGTAVNNRLQRRVYNVSLEGDFAQTQSIVRNIERLQPLTILRNYESTTNPADQVIEIDAQGRVVQPAQPPRLTTTFNLDVLLPAPEGTFEAAQQQNQADGENAE
jgi:type IV pilus assembly protein PilO